MFSAKHSLGLGLVLCVIAFSPSLCAQAQGEQPVTIRFQGADIPRDLFPPEFLPPVPLTEEERVTIERALQDLQSDSPERRAGAVMLLGKYEHSSARQPVVEALQDPEARVRRAALVSVSEWNRGAPGSAVIPVLNLLGDEDVDIRRTASSAVPTMLSIRRTYEIVRPGSMLEPIPEETKATLLAAFSDDDAVVRRNMVKNAYALGIDIPSDTWLVLLDDPDRQVRLGALPLAARNIPTDTFLLKAEEIAQREDRTERLQLARELSLRGANPLNQDILKTLSEDTDDEVAAEAMLGRLRFNPTNALMQKAVSYLRNDRMSQEQARRFFIIVRVAPDELVPYLPSLITLKDSTLRRAAIGTYLDFNLAEGKPEVMITFLDDPSPEVREEVLDYLSAGNGSLDDAIAEKLLYSPHKDLREGLVRLTEKLPPEEASDILYDLLLDESVDIRIQALRAITERQLPGWDKALSASLRDPDFQMQRQALALIFKYPFDGARAALIAFLADYPDSPLAPLIRARLGDSMTGT